MSINIEYKQKYLKYKQKYLELQKQLSGGSLLELVGDPSKMALLLQGASASLTSIDSLIHTHIEGNHSIFLNAFNFNQYVMENLGEAKQLYEKTVYDEYGNIFKLPYINEIQAEILKNVALPGSQSDRRDPGKNGIDDLTAVYDNLDPSEESSRIVFINTVNQFLPTIRKEKLAARNGDNTLYNIASTLNLVKSRIAIRAAFITGWGTFINSNNRTSKEPAPDGKTEKLSYGFNPDNSFTVIDNALGIISPIYTYDKCYKSDPGRSGRIKLNDNTKKHIVKYMVDIEMAKIGDDLSSMCIDLYGAVQVFLVNYKYDVGTVDTLKPYIKIMLQKIGESTSLIEGMKKFIVMYKRDTDDFESVFVQTDYFENKEEPDDGLSILFLSLCFPKVFISFDNINQYNLFKSHIQHYLTPSNKHYILHDSNKLIVLEDNV